MSHHDSIRNLLNIKDENIFFDEIFCTEETIKDVKAEVFYGTLTYQPQAFSDIKSELRKFIPLKLNITFTRIAT